LYCKDDLIREISDKDIDVSKFARMVMDDPEMRNEIVHLMLNHQKIMVYYHSYYVISQASESQPQLFYKYWDDFSLLLDHPNSYHRDFGLVLLANLTSVDRENRFLLLFEKYFDHVNDEKFMTAQCCIQNSEKILLNKWELREDIFPILLDTDSRCDFPEKQKELLKSYVIEVFDKFYPKMDNKEEINRFITAQLNSISPKTKKKAKEFVIKYNINF
jgi:hypothetical protein